MREHEINSNPLKMLLKMNAADEWAKQAIEYKKAGDPRAEQCSQIYEDFVGFSCDERESVRAEIVNAAIKKYPALVAYKQKLLSPDISDY